MVWTVSLCGAPTSGARGTHIEVHEPDERARAVGTEHGRAVVLRVGPTAWVRVRLEEADDGDRQSLHVTWR